MLLNPDDCNFETRDGADGNTHVAIFPNDPNHPKSDDLRREDLNMLPVYFQDEQAENYWCISHRSAAKVRADLEMLGYTWQTGNDDGALEDWAS